MPVGFITAQGDQPGAGLTQLLSSMSDTPWDGTWMSRERAVRNETALARLQEILTPEQWAGFMKTGEIRVDVDVDSTFLGGPGYIKLTCNSMVNVWRCSPTGQVLGSYCINMVDSATVIERLVQEVLYLRYDPFTFFRTANYFDNRWAMM